MKTAFEPYQLGNITLPNRFIMGSMHLGLEGMPETADRMIAFYGRRFDGGVGLIVTGGIGVNAVARGSVGFFNIQNEADRAELKKANDVLSKKGVMCAQLFHAGRYAFFRDLVGPSAIRAPINRYVPRALSEEECWDTIKDFGAAAKHALDCGFGAVEIMGSEGYLLNQFFSPVTNQRDDYFGGDHKRRMNFILEVLKAVKENLPEGYPVIIRMSGIDLIPGNPNFEEVCELAAALRDNGATALNIGIGWHESRVPTISQLVPRGAWSNIAGRIKAKTPGIPIIASNRVNAPDTAHEIFKKGEADLISMARPFLADAEIVNKITTDQPERINTCIACNQACLDHGVHEAMVSCIVNPEANRELEFAEMQKASPRKVVVVGSGPGGLEAARVAASLGHNVILFEKSASLGGQLNLAASIPGKFEFRETIRYFKNELDALGVDVRLNTSCDPQKLQELDADAVIFATGVRPRDFNIPGLENLHVGNYVDYLTGKFKPGKNVAVIGGGGIGCDVAHKLTEEHDPTLESYYKRYNVESYTAAAIQDKTVETKVSIFKRTGKPGAGLGPTTIWALLQELKSSGVEFNHGLNYVEATPEGLKINSKKKGEYVHDCDTIISCIGQESENSLAQSYRAAHPDKQVFIVGGAKDARGVDAKRAFLEGALAAREIGTGSAKSAGVNETAKSGVGAH